MKFKLFLILVLFLWLVSPESAPLRNDLLLIALAAIVVSIAVFIIKYRQYRKGAYYQVTKRPYLSVRGDLGYYGEYLIYKCLKYMEAGGAKFLFNVYIPKENGETTEVDVLVISTKGVFVFESKNYSGWIFGNENQKNWYQTLPAGRGRSHKEHFYNPVMQNRSHIMHLRTFLGEQTPLHSIIVFSNRCTLKNVQISSPDISVINRYDIKTVVSAICEKTPNDVLNEVDVFKIYNALYPFTQVDEGVKAQHVANIHNHLNHLPAHLAQPIYTPSPVQVAEELKPTEVQTDKPSVETVVLNDAEIPNAVSRTDPFEKPPEEPPMLKCPRCNGNLVLRTATRGANAGNQFYGCSNYPKCKYIQNKVQ